MENKPIPPRTFYRETIWTVAALYGFALAGFSTYRAISVAEAVPAQDYVSAFEERIAAFRPDIESAPAVRFYIPAERPGPGTSDQLRFMMTQYVLAPVPLTWKSGQTYEIRLAPDTDSEVPAPETGTAVVRQTSRGDLLIKRGGELR